MWRWWPWRWRGCGWIPPPPPSGWSACRSRKTIPNLAMNCAGGSHLQPGASALIARGRWRPRWKRGQATGCPCFNDEDDRRRLEIWHPAAPGGGGWPLPWLEPAVESGSRPGPAPNRHAPWLLGDPAPSRCGVTILSGWWMPQLRSGFSPKADGLDPLLDGLAAGPGSGQGASCGLAKKRSKRLDRHPHWREAVAGRVAPPGPACRARHTARRARSSGSCASACRPSRFTSLKFAGRRRRGRLVKPAVQLGRDQRSASRRNLLLEGLTAGPCRCSQPIRAGPRCGHPLQMELAPPKPSMLVRTAAARLRDVAAVGVVLPPAQAVGLASRWACSIEAGAAAKSRGFSLGEKPWSGAGTDDGGSTLTLKDLEAAGEQAQPTGAAQGGLDRLRPGDLRNAEKFLRPRIPRSARLRLRLTGNEGRKPAAPCTVHRSRPGHGCRGAGAVHQQKAPDPLPAPEGFAGQARPVSGAGPGLAGLPAPLQTMAPAWPIDRALARRSSSGLFLSTSSPSRKLKRPCCAVRPHLRAQQLESVRPPASHQS